MNRIRSLAIATLLVYALTAFAQQNSGTESNSGTEVDRHMKVLTERLDLTPDQQDKVKLIVSEMQNATAGLMHDESMSRDERMSKVRDVRYKADRKVRVILTDEQRTKLDQLEEEFHFEQHSDLHGAAAPPRR